MTMIPLLLSTVLETADGTTTRGMLGIMGGTALTGERERQPFLKAFAMAPERTWLFTRLVVGGTVDFIARSS